MDFSKAQSPFICSAVWLTDFDSFDWEANDNDMMDEPELNGQWHPTDHSAFKKKLVELAEQWDRGAKSDWPLSSGHNQCLHRLACVMASTSHLQESAEGHLEKLGFQKIGPFKKLKHAGSELSIWIMAATDFMDAIGYPGILKILEEEEKQKAMLASMAMAL